MAQNLLEQIGQSQAPRCEITIASTGPGSLLPELHTLQEDNDARKCVTLIYLAEIAYKVI
jgi:hypothetical protein